MDLLGRIDVYRQKREKKEEIEAALKDAKYELEEAEAALVEAMVYEEVESMNVAGRLYYVSTKTHYSCPAECSEELFGLLRRDGLGDIIKEKVDPRTLSSAMREMAEQCGGTLPEGYADIVSSYDKTTIGMRRG